MKTTSSFERISPDNEYSYYRSKIVARRQARNYKSKLSRYSGIIQNRQKLGLNGIQLYESLLCDGITTSLSSVYRELRNINEKKRLQERKNESNQDQQIVCKTSDPGNRFEQSHV